MEEFLRNWRQDALNKHQHDAAIFVGDKLLALTGDPKDAFWLAQVHFGNGHYNRALSFLTRNDLISKSTSCRYLAALCLMKQSKYDEALTILGEKNPSHLAFNTPQAARRKKTSGGKGDEYEKGNLKFEAAMCHLRGLIYAKQNAFDKAKDCYKQAVLIDVKCFEAFDQLMKNSLMSPDEEWAFLESLDFANLSVDGEQGQEAQFAKMLYTTRLSKYKNPTAFNQATEKLSTDYNLANNADLIVARSELLFTQCRFKECLQLCEGIIKNDSYNFAVYPLYLACMHELNMKNKLFLVSHDMADSYPDEPVTWLAVGIYYLTINKIAEARRFFSKASMMDPHFGPAWIGFAHTFAAEGEHDQAISAYSTAARLFQGTHLPQLFLGMQHLQLNNVTLADEYLNTAFNLCKSDPLLLNELGVVFYHKDALQDSIKCFTKALQIADDIESNPKAWVATKANLGHAFRRLEMFDKALVCFAEVTRTADTNDPQVYSAIGLCHLQAGRPWEAIVNLHEALAISPQDPVATELLEKALAENADKDSIFTTTMLNTDGTLITQDSDDVDAIIRSHQREQRSKRSGGSTSRPQSSHQAPRAPAAPRRRLADVTRDYGGMEVSDEDEL
ncbi:hypothetical protein FPQ18DRAFT_258865 [Pyronema domesticum]|nr:hypothetical protein FPQ18DRAFT_258865 [Pyronema domesticum]